MSNQNTATMERAAIPPLSSSDLLAELEAELKFSGEQADKSRGDNNQYWRGRLHGAHKALDTARRCSANA